MKIRPSAFCWNHNNNYCEELHLVSNVRDCKESAPEDGNVKVEKDMMI